MRLIDLLYAFKGEAHTLLKFILKRHALLRFYDLPVYTGRFYCISNYTVPTHRFSHGMHNDSSSRAFSFAVIKSITRASYIARSTGG